MYAKIFTMIALFSAFTFSFWAFFTIRRLKKRLLEMSDILEDVKNGNHIDWVFGCSKCFMAEFYYALRKRHLFILR